MKSPLKAKPLRNPGQSVESELQDLLYDEILFYYLSATLITILAALEWFRWYRGTPPTPMLFSFFAFLAIIVAVWKIRRSWSKAKNLKLGRDGERAVGQFLDSLRSIGAEVIHDIPGKNFNLDHVIIHPSGVYVIETKSWSKPDRGEARILFDGEKVTRFGQSPDRNPIIQVRAAKSWLAELIETSTGRKTAVRAVVVFPGWYIEPTAESRSSDVWVLNPKALPAFIKHSAVHLQPEEVKLIAYHISRYVRSECSG